MLVIILKLYLRGKTDICFLIIIHRRQSSIIEKLASKDDEWIKVAGEKSYSIALSMYDSRKTVQRVRKELCEE